MSEQRQPIEEVKVGSLASTLPYRIPPVADACLLHGGLPDDAHPRVVMSQAAVRQVARHCESDTQVELGGVLLGHAYLHNQQVFVQVEAAIPAITDDQGPVHFTFTGDAWAQLHADKQELYPDLDIVGWFHTHPDLGVFFSADDEVVHAAAFTQPWHVGLVVDPIRQTASYFGWSGREIRPILGFYELILPDAAPEGEIPRTAVKWEIDVDDSWLYMPTTTYASPPDPLAFPAISPWVGAILGGMALAISLINLYLYLRG